MHILSQAIVRGCLYSFSTKFLRVLEIKPSYRYGLYEIPQIGLEIVRNQDHDNWIHYLKTNYFILKFSFGTLSFVMQALELN